MRGVWVPPSLPPEGVASAPPCGCGCGWCAWLGGVVGIAPPPLWLWLWLVAYTQQIAALTFCIALLKRTDGAHRMLTFTTAALFTFCVTLLEAKQNASFRVAGPLRSFLYESLKNHKKIKVSGSGILDTTLRGRCSQTPDPTHT